MAHEKLRISRAVIVEGRDDVDAVGKACDALIIPTHGYGISAETWALIEKAYEEKGIIILTDPDAAGERIRKRITERFPDAVQCYLTKKDAVKGDDIGIENASPEAIAEALLKATGDNERILRTGNAGVDRTPVTASDLIRLGLSGCEGSSQLRELVCSSLGIGHCNARSMLVRLKGFGIDKDEFEKTVIRIKSENKE